MQDILPKNADVITNAFLNQLQLADNNNDETVYLNDNKKSTIDDKKQQEKTHTEHQESPEPPEFEIYETDREESNEPPEPPITSNKSSENATKNLENNDTHITTTTTSSSDDNTHNISDKIKIQMDKEEVKQSTRTDIITPIVDDLHIKADEDTKTQEKEKVSIKDVGSRTMEQWLNRDNLIVHPVWIGNLPRGTTVNQLRHFVESAVGRVLVSIHISVKQPSNNERTYAFLNLPTAEKQLLAVTLLDGKIFTAEKLIVRPKRPSKFPQSFFGSSPISEHFKHFRDCVVPAILANPTINLNVTSVRKILEQNHINIDHLPNRVWCVQCTLVPQCHRTYCSFYHCHQEKELGRIISILAAQICGDSTAADGGDGVVGNDPFSIEHKKNLERANNPNTVRSRHTLLIQGLPRSITSKKIEETFEVFGEIDNVIVNPDHTCYVRMKRSQDARKIVHLFKYNHAGVIVDFAPYGASKMGALMGKKKHDVSHAKLGLHNYATAPGQNRYGGTVRPNLQKIRSDGVPHSRTVPSLPITNTNPNQAYNYYNYGGGGGKQNARASLQLNMQTHSEPIPQQYNNQNNLYTQQMQMQMQQRGGYNNNQGFNTMMMQQMTPQQYTEYYNQMMQQQRYYQQNMNGMVQGYNTQQRYYMQNNNTNNANASASAWNGYMNNNVFSPTNMNNNPYAYPQHNALSPIAQTPNMNQMMNGMNVTSPPITSPRVVSPPQVPSVSYGNARQQLLLKGSYSTNDAHAHAQQNNPPQYTQQTRDDSAHYYQQYNDYIQQQQQKNMQHKNWMQTQPAQPPQAQATQFTYKNVKPVAPGDEGALPNAPQIAEPVLNFKLSAHGDFPLSPMSALNRQ